MSSRAEPTRRPVLRGRQAECQQLERLVEAARGGASRVLVMSGEAGIGKSALLDHLVAAASGCRVVRAAGVHAEAELAFAGLHQLCTPLLHRLDRIPAPQRDAVGVAFGLRTGPTPNRFLLHLGVLTLLTEAAADRPLVCLLDDAQWLDQASAQALAFAARRLTGEPIALVFALRDPADNQSLAGLPQLALGGLRPADARDLLAAAIPGPLDERVSDRIVAETRGNPLTVLELARSCSYVGLAGGFGLPGQHEVAGGIEDDVRRRIEDDVRRRLSALPPDAGRLLLAAAVDPTGDPALMSRAASRLGVTVHEHDLTAFAGLLRWGARVTFRHPHTRSVVYGRASQEERRAAHRVLAEATDPVHDADRRAWHRAHSVPGPDEDVAAELERCAGRAQACGGLAAAAAFLQRATYLTPGADRRVQRALAAAHAAVRIGASDSTLVLLAVAEAGPADELQQARIDLLRAKLAAARRPGAKAASLLLAAAARIEPLDVELARATYLEAVTAAVFTEPAGAVRIARAARRVPAPREPSRVHLLLDALTTRLTEGYAAAAPRSKRALRAFTQQDLPAEAALDRLGLASAIAADLWDDESWHILTGRHVTTARTAGGLDELALALDSRVAAEVLCGRLPAAAALVDEANAGTGAIAAGSVAGGALLLAAWQGHEPDALRPGRTTVVQDAARQAAVGSAVAHTADAVLANGSGCYERAIAAAQRAATCAPDLAAGWALSELIEAAARLGRRDLAADAVARLAETTRASGTDWALGIEARARALLSDDDSAEPLYREAIERLGRTRVRLELARARLLYGEWLHRSHRRMDSREQLRAAEQMFTLTGAEAFAERARRELAATGEKARRRTVTTPAELTARETQIARMARDGLTNPEIGRRLFLSPRTIEYHLGNVFAKLAITSRHELDRALTGPLAQGRPA
jgi:DNA-binding CsgD family transcriptional regulator/tetratricopeptide (TPR) repeat protein